MNATTIPNQQQSVRSHCLIFKLEAQNILNQTILKSYTLTKHLIINKLHFINFKEKITDFITLYQHDAGMHLENMEVKCHIYFENKC
jgi:hypothetical protein